MNGDDGIGLFDVITHPTDRRLSADSSSRSSGPKPNTPPEAYLQVTLDTPAAIVGTPGSGYPADQWCNTEDGSFAA